MSFADIAALPEAQKDEILDNKFTLEQVKAFQNWRKTMIQASIQRIATKQENLQASIQRGKELDARLQASNERIESKTQQLIAKYTQYITIAEANP